jgi:hypothetical protein
LSGLAAASVLLSRSLTMGPFHQKIRKIGKHYQKKRMIGNPRMPGKIAKVHSFRWSM